MAAVSNELWAHSTVVLPSRRSCRSQNGGTTWYVADRPHLANPSPQQTVMLLLNESNFFGWGTNLFGMARFSRRIKWTGKSGENGRYYEPDGKSGHDKSRGWPPGRLFSLYGTMAIPIDCVTERLGRNGVHHFGGVHTRINRLWLRAEIWVLVTERCAQLNVQSGHSK